MKKWPNQKQKANTNIKEISGRLNSEKENPFEEDPQYNCHRSENASENKAVAVAQFKTQQHSSLCPSGSVVVAEPLHPHPKQSLSPEGGAILSHNCGWCTSTHTCPRWSTCCGSNLRHNENLTTLKNSNTNTDQSI